MAAAYGHAAAKASVACLFPAVEHERAPAELVERSGVRSVAVLAFAYAALGTQLVGKLLYVREAV